MDDLALFERALRAAVPTRPDPRIGADLVPRLAESARMARIAAGEGSRHASTARPPRRSGRLLVARVGIAAAAIPFLFAGLAVAGITVPGPAREAFEAAGVELPNQPAGNEDARGGTTDGAPGTSEDPGAPATGRLPSEASSKARANRKANGLDDYKPGRRVHGQPLVPGPASPPEGRALGPANKEVAGASGASSGKGNASAQAGTGNSGGNPPTGHGKP